MKVNKIYILIWVVAAIFMVSCEEYEDTVEPGPAVSADNPGVRFSAMNNDVYEVTQEGLTFTLTVNRDSSSTGAIEVPIAVVSDTSDVFTVPASVSFAANEFSTTINISITDAASKGVYYGIEIACDEQFVNPYKSEYSSYFGEIAISVYENLGTAQFYDSFSFYSVAEVSLEHNTVQTDMYRVSFPYSEGILVEAEWRDDETDWIGGTTQPLIYFTVTENGNVTWQDGFWYTNLLYEGVPEQEIKAYIPTFVDEELGDIDALSVAETDESGNIIYFELYPYFYIDDLGGFGTDYPVFVGFPGFDLAGALGLDIYSE